MCERERERVCGRWCACVCVRVCACVWACPCACACARARARASVRCVRAFATFAPAHARKAGAGRQALARGIRFCRTFLHAALVRKPTAMRESRAILRFFPDSSNRVRFFDSSSTPSFVCSQKSKEFPGRRPCPRPSTVPYAFPMNKARPSTVPCLFPMNKARPFAVPYPFPMNKARPFAVLRRQVLRRLFNTTDR